MALRSKKMSTAEAFLTMFNDEMLSIRTSFTAEITNINVDEIDGALLSVDVQPLIQQTISPENADELIYRNLPVIAGVPVVFPHSTVSGFSLTIPIKIGDQVLIVISDRSIDEWQRTGAVSRPAETVTPRAHDLTDAIAIIGISCDVKNVKNYNFDKATVRNVDGTIAVEVSNDDVVIKKGDISATVGDNITLLNDSSSITITPNSITITADTVTIDGGQFDMSSDGNTATDADIVGNTGVSLNDHVHEIIDPSPGEPVTPPIP